jgi:thiol-disulfide isomerase/thioredoxin
MKHQQTRVLVTWILSALLLAGSGLPGPAAATDPAPVPLSADDLRALLGEQSGRVVLLNFWATWCRPCLKEIPALTDLQSRYAEDGVVLIPVSLDEPDTAASVVPGFLAQWFPGFRTWLSAEPEMDTIVSVVDRAWNEVLPTSYVIGRNGAVAARLQGGKTEAEFEAALRAALAL